MHHDGGKKSARKRTLWLSTWLVLPCQPFLKHDQTFCFHCLPFLIASLLSKQKAIFLSAMNHPYRSVSQFQIINWGLGTENIPMQPCTIITSTWLCLSNALSAVKFPSSASTLDILLPAKTWTLTACSLEQAHFLCHVVIVVIISEWQMCNDREVVNTELWLSFMVTISDLCIVLHFRLYVINPKDKGGNFNCQVVKHSTLRFCLHVFAYQVLMEV